MFASNCRRAVNRAVLFWLLLAMSGPVWGGDALDCRCTVNTLEEEAARAQLTFTGVVEDTGHPWYRRIGVHHEALAQQAQLGMQLCIGEDPAHARLKGNGGGAAGYR